MSATGAQGMSAQAVADQMAAAAATRQARQDPEGDGMPWPLPTPTPTPTPNAIAPELGAYLAPILERWRIAKAEADEATERADALSREVKDACIAAGLQTTTLTDTSGRPVARFEETSGWRLATAKLKVEHPEIYAAYAAQSTTRRLVPVK